MELDEIYCRMWCNEHRKNCSCGFEDCICIFKPTSNQHYAEMRCPNCDKFHGYIKNPASNKSRRPAAHKDLVAKSGLEYCQMCLRKKSELVLPDTLHGHHIIEYADGGTDDLSNVLVVCTACHSLIHWMRTYVNRPQILN